MIAIFAIIRYIAWISAALPHSKVPLGIILQKAVLDNVGQSNVLNALAAELSLATNIFNMRTPTIYLSQLRRR